MNHIDITSNISQNAFRLALQYDIPISMNYLNPDCFIGLDANHRPRFVNHYRDYSNIIHKMYKVDDCFIIVVGK